MLNKEKEEKSKCVRNRANKRMIIFLVLIMVSFIFIGCNKSKKVNMNESDKVEETDTIIQPTVEAVPTKAPDSPVEAAPTKAPDSPVEPVPTKAPDSPVEPELTKAPDSPVEPVPTKEPDSPVEPAPTQKPESTIDKSVMSDFIPSTEVVYGTTALRQGDYVFYKTGKIAKMAITAQNIKTNKVTDIVIVKDKYEPTGDFYLVGSTLYYQVEGDIYKVDVNGTNQSRIYKGKANILGIYKEEIYARDINTKELFKIDKSGEKTVIVKLKGVNPLEAVLMDNGIYYIHKGVNNTFNGNDPMDRLYYMDYNGKNKKELCAELDIYNLKTNGTDLFFLAISEDPAEMRINKISDNKLFTIHRVTKEEYEERGSQWYFASSFVLLGVNATEVYYGVDYNMVDDLLIYSVGTDGTNPGLFLDARTIKGIDSSAYFSSGYVEGEYLGVLFDCDSNPNELHLIHLKDKTSIIFSRGRYIGIDLEGEYLYYCRAASFDSYLEERDLWEYGRVKFSSLKYGYQN